jgi:hypothetical protein
VVIVNCAQPQGSTALERALSATMRAVFGSDRVWRDPSQPVNTMLLGTAADVGDPAEQLRSAAPGLPTELAAVAVRAADRIAPALGGGEVFTDDRAPVEWMVDLSLAKQAR